MDQKNQKKKRKIITIDGPAGAGKSTVSKMLAEKMGWIYVDTGALYRGVAYEVQRCQTDIENQAALDALLETVHFEFRSGENGFLLFSSGQDITGSIRSAEISMLASTVSALPAVREKLLGIQREMAHQYDAVFEGRDMGTVVFPDADHKFFLVADLEIRAERRFAEMESNGEVAKGGNTLNEIKDAMAMRDHNDRTRKESPLKPATDAVTIDSTNLSSDQVVEQLMKHISI